MPMQDFLDDLLQGLDRLLGRETDIETRAQLAGYHVGRAGSGRNVRDLKAGRLKVLVALIPNAGREFRERRRQSVHGIVGQLWIGDVSLNSVHGETSAQAAAAPDLDGVAQRILARRLADQAPVDTL